MTQPQKRTDELAILDLKMRLGRPNDRGIGLGDKEIEQYLDGQPPGSIEEVDIAEPVEASVLSNRLSMLENLELLIRELEYRIGTSQKIRNLQDYITRQYYREVDYQQRLDSYGHNPDERRLLQEEKKFLDEEQRRYEKFIQEAIMPAHQAIEDFAKWDSTTQRPTSSDWSQIVYDSGHTHAYDVLLLNRKFGAPTPMQISAGGNARMSYTFNVSNEYVENYNGWNATSYHPEYEQPALQDGLERLCEAYDIPPTDVGAKLRSLQDGGYEIDIIVPVGSPIQSIFEQMIDNKLTAIDSYGYMFSSRFHQVETQFTEAVQKINNREQSLQATAKASLAQMDQSIDSFCREAEERQQQFETSQLRAVRQWTSVVRETSDARKMCP